MEYICYIFLTLAAALEGEATINAYFNVPVSDDAVTRTMCEIDSTSQPGLYLIPYNPAFGDVLGIPDTIFIN